MENSGWKEKLNDFKIPLALIFLGLILISGGIASSGLKKTQNKIFPRESMIKQETLISVDVSGAVNKAGVYQLKEGARIEEALVLAGGLADEANKEYISKYLNLAQKLSDGTKLYIPFTGEEGQVQGTIPAAARGAVSRININTAAQPELEALPGIGPVTASRIISNRPYQSADELVAKKSVSAAVFEKIKDSVSVY